MINIKLQKEIINHIFQLFAVFEDTQISMFDKINCEKFLLNKKIVFEAEDKSIVEHKIYSYYTTFSDAEVKVILADTSEEFDEYTMIFQMDTNPPCALRLSVDENDFGSFYINIENNKWINPGTALHARILMGVEALSEMPSDWKKKEDFEELYKILVGFLNFYETED